MPLPLPSLDRLTYGQLVAEARASLPALAPGWTDFNAHDPGITLIELMAWLAENASYRLDNIPDESARAFLRLLGVVLAPAQIAETLVVLATAGAAQPLTKATVVASDNGDIEFQTAASLYVFAAHLQVVLSISSSEPTDVIHRNTGATSYFPLGENPQVGDAFYLGFDAAFIPADMQVSLGIWTNRIAEDRSTRMRLVAEQNATVEEIETYCADQPTAAINWLNHYGVQTQWEYYASNHQWQPLQDVKDYTRALTLTGTVNFTAPADQLAGGAPLQNQSGRFYIRCRLARGSYDCPPQIAYAAVNVVRARHAVAAAPETFRSNGCASQEFQLTNMQAPLVSAQIEVSLTGSYQNGVAQASWRVASTWDGGGAHSRLCVLNSETGTLTFGDGRNGRVPPAGAQIKVHFRRGGGTKGNVAANQLTKLPLPFASLVVTQPFAAEGGKRAETLNQAKARAARELVNPTRAVTLGDFETLAMATPGVPIARVHAIADYHPKMSCIPVSGSITLVVIPFCPFNKPMPSAALLTTVQNYLERRRLLTSEVHVVAPHYSTITVTAELHPKAEVNRRQLMQSAHAALEKYFHPLQGGAEGKGWPIGRAVYRSELLALLNELDGVLYVSDLSWQLNDKPASRCGNLELCCTGLLVSGNHTITINQGSACHE